MQRTFCRFAALLLSTVSVWAAQTTSPRQVLRADYGWKFLLGDPDEARAIAHAFRANPTAFMAQRSESVV